MGLETEKRWNDVIMQITSLNQPEKCEKQIIKLILRANLWRFFLSFFASFLDIHIFRAFSEGKYYYPRFVRLLAMQFDNEMKKFKEKPVEGSSKSLFQISI